MSHSISLGSISNISTARIFTCGAKQRTSQQTKQQQQAKLKHSVVGFNTKKKEESSLSWACVQGCGACCKLVKGPSFATPEEIFEDPLDLQLYKSLIGSDGWCIHFDKPTRTCSIYSDRPYFCRVEPGVFENLYGIQAKKFNKEACSCCRDTIKAIYGARSQELEKFNQNLKNSSSSSSS
ncbi:zinc/iron-chelating domain protein [Thalictrum thalictroides]|uniref:Zinc/iron-chelating domain protein n=1 Tax=Thalictrum thalictroides TaxID=46969 RepID=A0A7J6VK92_THATH|nr:zinc/iron-chelating domain protein [Thalictrum thalictroides]